MLTRGLRVACIASVLVAAAVDSAGAQRPVTIRGTVISRGRPLQNMTVRIYPGGRYDAPLSDVTDATGTFAIPVPGSPDTAWQTLTIVIAPLRSHKGLVTPNVKRDPQRQLGPYEVESYTDSTAADLGRMLDALEEVNLFAGNSHAVREGVEGLKTLFPGDFPPGSPLAARADHLERMNPNLFAGLPGRDTLFSVIGAVPGVLRIDQASIGGAAGYNNVMLDAVAGTDAFSLEPASPRPSTVSLSLNRFSAANVQGGDNIVPRSGTNTFAGSAFEYFRHRNLNGNTRIHEALSRPKGGYRADRYGGSVGGPIFRNRHFFFVSFEGRRLTQEQTVFVNVPDGVAPNDAVAAALRRLEPLAGDWDLHRRQSLSSARTDHNVTDGHRLALRFNHETFSGQGFQQEGTQQSGEAAETARVTTTNGSASLVSFSARALNDLRVQYGRNRDAGEPGSTNPYAQIREQGTLVLAIGGSVFAARQMSTTRLQVADSFSWVSSSHQVKAGFDIQADSSARTYEPNFAGAYVFDSLEAFALGVPSVPSDTFTQAFAGPGTTGATTHPDLDAYSAFVQDDWRVTSDLTLNLGLRYQGQRLGLPDTPMLHDLAPRIGAALGPYGRSFVIRGNYGVFSGSTSAQMVAAALANDGDNVQTLTFHGGSGDLLPRYPDRLTAIPAATSVRPARLDFDRDFRNALRHEANGVASVEWRGHAFNMQYSFAKGTRLPQSVDVNVGQALPVTFSVAGTGGRLQHYRFAPGPVPQYARVISLRSTAESAYHAGTVEVTGRRSGMLMQYTAAYTLATLADTVSNSTGLAPESVNDRRFPSNPSNVDADRAAGDSDVRHRFVARAQVGSGPLANLFPESVYPVVRNWMLSAQLVVESGLPYSAYVTTDINGDRNRFNDIAPGTARNQFRMPGRSFLDLRIAKDIGGGRRAIAIGLEAYNVLNRANYTHVNNTLYAVEGTTLRPNPMFGQLTEQADPRIVQVGVRISF